MVIEDEIKITEETRKNMEIIEKQVNENYQQSFELLTLYFKALYENAGMEWTEKNQNDILFIMNSISMRSVFNSTVAMLAEVYHEKEQK
jgi:hypothetical protein